MLLTDALRKGSRAEKDKPMRVVRVDKHRAGFGGARMMRNLSRGHMHDPNEVVRVNVTVEGTVEQLMGREVFPLVVAEARRNGLFGQARRVSNPHTDHMGRMVASYEVS